MSFLHAEKKPFSELLSNIVDNRGKTCPTSESGIPLIATNCIKNESLYPLYEKVRYVSEETFSSWFRGHPAPGDLLFVSKGTPGQVCLVPSKVDFCIAQDMVAVRADSKKVDPKYLFAVLRSPEIQGEIENLHVGSLIPHFKKGDFDKLLIPVPERKIQEYTGEQYFNFSAKIDLLQRQNKTLEGMARALWRRMFVEEEKEEWDKVKLGEIVELQRGISYSGNLLGEVGNGVPMHNLNSIEINGSYKYDGIKYYTGAIKEKQKLKPRDLLIINTDITQENRIIGWPILVPINFNESTFTHHLYSINIIRNGISKLFLYYLLGHYREILASSANGTTVTMLSKEAINSLELRVPPLDKQNEFESMISSALNKQYFNSNHINALSLFRNTLLPKLMSGEVMVRI